MLVGLGLLLPGLSILLPTLSPSQQALGRRDRGVPHERISAPFHSDTPLLTLPSFGDSVFGLPHVFGWPTDFKDGVTWKKDVVFPNACNERTWPDRIQDAGTPPGLPSTWAFLGCSPHTWAGSWMGGGGAGPQASILIGDAGAPSGALTHCATMPQISLLMFPCAFEGKHTLRTPQMYWEN